MSYSKPLNLIIEGALLASDNPLSLQDIANLFDTDKPSKNDIQKTIDALNDNYKNHLPCKALVFIKYNSKVELEVNKISNLILKLKSDTSLAS